MDRVLVFGTSDGGSTPSGRTMKQGSLAQLVEQSPLKRSVVGSNPTGPTMAEKLKVLDSEGKEIGQILDRDLIHQKGLWHREVAIWIFNDKGEVLLQRRSKNKKQSPNKLGLCAGHVEYTQDSIKTAQNELLEEIGVSVNKKDLLYLKTEKKEKIFSKKIINRIFNDVYYTLINKDVSDFKIQREELSEVLWIDYLAFKERVLNNDNELTVKAIDPESINTLKLLDKIYYKITTP